MTERGDAYMAIVTSAHKTPMKVFLTSPWNTTTLKAIATPGKK